MPEKTVSLTQQECARTVTDNPLAYPKNVMSLAHEYLTDLGACGKQSLGISSPEVDKAWASGDKFWAAFRGVL